MATIKLFPLAVRRLKLNDLSGLCTETIDVCAGLAEKSPSDLLVVGFAKLKADVAQFNTLLNRSPKSPITSDIVELDKKIGELFAEIKRTAKMSEKSSTPAKRNAGKVLLLVLHSFWKITSKAINTQSAEIGQLADRIGTDMEAQEALITLGIKEVWDQTVSTNIQLKALYLQRTNQNTAYLATPSATSMQDTVIVSYNDFCIVTEQLFLTMPSPDLESIFYCIDVIRRKYAMPTKSDLKDAVIAPVPQQNYTGQPVTPPVDVFYVGKRLVLGKDYNVTYKKNIEAGDASVTIHGKGEYRGKHTTSFYIARPL